MIIKNNTIFFIICFFKGNDDFYVKISVAILTIYLYILVNIILMFNSAGLHLYLGEKEEKLNIISFFLNITIPYLTLIYPVIRLKKYLSVKEKIDDIYYELYTILIQKSKIKNKQKMKKRKRK